MRETRPRNLKEMLVEAKNPPELFGQELEGSS